MEEEEKDITYKKNAVFSTLQPKHPVTYKSYNLCKLFPDGKHATKFSIADLKEICDSFEIETADFKRRKSEYTEALANVLNSCTRNTIQLRQGVIVRFNNQGCSRYKYLGLYNLVDVPTI